MKKLLILFVLLAAVRIAQADGERYELEQICWDTELEEEVDIETCNTTDHRYKLVQVCRDYEDDVNVALSFCPSGM